MPVSTLSRLPMLCLLFFGLGTLLLFIGADSEFATPAAPFLFLGQVLLWFSLASFVIYLVFSLLRDHVAWRRRLDE